MARRQGALSKKTIQMIMQAHAILDEQRPMTIRQLFYQLVSKGYLENNHGNYQKVSKNVTKGRELGRIPWQWIVDRSRPEYVANMWDNVADYAETVKHSYRRDYWQFQDIYTEVWSEKDAITGVIEDITKKYGVIFRAFTKAFQAQPS